MTCSQNLDFVISGLFISIGQQITMVLPRQKLLQCSTLSSHLTIITCYINNSTSLQITQWPVQLHNVYWHLRLLSLLLRAASLSNINADFCEPAICSKPTVSYYQLQLTRACHGYGNTRSDRVIGTVSDFSTLWHTVYPYHGIMGMIQVNYNKVGIIFTALKLFFFLILY